MKLTFTTEVTEKGILYTKLQVDEETTIAKQHDKEFWMKIFSLEQKMHKLIKDERKTLM